jgi:5-methylcytosine-specific restriction endonuclease McrA
MKPPLPSAHTHPSIVSRIYVLRFVALCGTIETYLWRYKGGLDDCDGGKVTNRRGGSTEDSQSTVYRSQILERGSDSSNQVRGRNMVGEGVGCECLSRKAEVPQTRGNELTLSVADVASISFQPFDATPCLSYLVAYYTTIGDGVGMELPKMEEIYSQLSFDIADAATVTSKRTSRRRTEKQQERARETTREWKKRNPDKKRAESTRYRNKNLARLRILKREYAARYKREHPEEYRIKRTTYLQSPQGKSTKKLEKVRSRTLKSQASGTFTLQQFYARCEYYGWCCYLCGKELTPQTVTIEHRIPLSRTGTNWPANLAPSCKPCNSKKGTKTELEYRLIMEVRQR